jgi:hypothetical protein
VANIVPAPNFQYKEQSSNTVHVDKNSHYTVAKTSPESTNRKYTSLKLNKNRFTNHAFPGAHQKSWNYTKSYITSLELYQELYYKLEIRDLTKNLVLSR